MYHSHSMKNSFTSTTFTFTSHAFNPTTTSAVFEFVSSFDGDKEDLIFTEEIFFDIKNPQELPEHVLEELLKLTHITLGVSYYKLYLPPEIKLNFDISKSQADFFNTLYQKGLGEFYFQNDIDPNTFPGFPHAEHIENSSLKIPTLPQTLLGIGGGKDSIVAAKFLEKQNKDFEPFEVLSGKPSDIITSVSKTLGKENYVITRALDPQIFEEHEGSFNGHVPISSIIASLATFAAAIRGDRYVAVGNEHSANFGNTTFKGVEINHQYSKSVEFETLFQNYIHDHITPSVVYFSPLRPFFEIRIVKEFVQHEEFLKIFSSCNRNFKINKPRGESLWCCECPKCVFAFTLFAAFLSEEKLVDVFGKNMFEEESLINDFKDILGLGDMKPFECVGTFEEAQAAFKMASEKHKNTAVVSALINDVTITEKEIEDLFKTQAAKTIPDSFIFSGINSVAILGYGKEGQATEKYITTHAPDTQIIIADKKDGEDYIEKAHTADLIIKTPGMPKEKVKGHYTTASNIFFAQLEEEPQITRIGITGSKGKSTTASLIFHILEKAGKKVKLLGNIGSPMLDALEDIKNTEIIVTELSSYQLDDIKYSPDIAVVTSLFRDHLNYHGSEKNYFSAKANIYKHQTSEDILILPHLEKEFALFAESANSEVVEVGFSEDKIETTLLGQHNISNILLGIEAVKHIGISKQDALEAVKTFSGLSHRLENIGAYKDITFYDDAISTTPESTIAALDSLEHVSTLFLGGEDRGYDFSKLIEKIKEKGVKNIVLFPETGNQIFELIKDDNFNILKTESMEKAVAFAFEHTEKNTICLLSTASPSYSLWKDFNEKGDEFKACVQKMSS